MTKPNQNASIEANAVVTAGSTYQAVLRSVTIGSVAGAFEVIVDHPLWSMKTRSQCGDPFTMNPFLLYRGILPNAASMIPITGIQVGLDCAFKSIVFNGKKELSRTERISSAFIAGLGSALASCPTEMAMTRQKKTGEGFYEACRYLKTQHGWQALYRGLPATMMREGIFTAFFLAGTPMIKASIQPYVTHDNMAAVVAGVSSGVLASVVSQAADTVKTMQQAEDGPKALSFQQAVKHRYATQGWLGFFKGGIPRGARVMSAVTIMGFVTEKMEDMVKPKQALEASTEDTRTPRLSS